ncbi:class I SAM-dependent methyltransferase [bacterium]|nr:class I SAM-dependent methyltransferase [bacterium]
MNAIAAERSTIGNRRERKRMNNYYSARSAQDPYFADRRSNPYRSTLAFEAFLAKQRFFDTLPKGALVADIACGTGSETAYLAARHPHLNFIGVDLQQHFIDAATARHADIGNLQFTCGDIYSLHRVAQWGDVHAVWLSQTLSWLPWWRAELLSLVGPQVDRIALSTLAWDGMIESKVIHYLGRREDPDTESVFYNVYSIPAMRDQMVNIGFAWSAVEKFEIDIDLKPPRTGDLGSYTISTTMGERLTFSTWQYLPWHFLMFSKRDLTTT